MTLLICYCSDKSVTCLQEIEIALEVEYAGKCEIAIDADLVSFVYVLCKLILLSLVSCSTRLLT